MNMLQIREKHLLSWIGTTLMMILLLGLILGQPKHNAYAAGNEGVEDFVTRLYNICLDRNPDPEGFNG